MKNAKILFFILFLIISSLIIAFFNFKRNLTIEKILSTNAHKIHLEFNSIYKKHKLFANIIFDSYIKEDSSILLIINKANGANKAQQEELRNDLYTLLLKDYSYLSKLLNVRQLHFHLKNNESFLRMHKPSVFGDNLTLVRPTVAYVNKYYRPIDGFEEGKIYNGFRFVYPLFLNEKHIGSAEVSYSSYEIILDMINNYNISSNLLINKHIIETKAFKDQKLNYIKSPIPGYMYDKEVAQKLGKRFNIENIALNSINEIIRKIPEGKAFSLYDVNDQIITIIPQKNRLSKEYVAAFIIKGSAEGIRSVNENFYFLIFFSLFLLFIIIYFFYTKYAYDTKIELQNTQMKAILNSEAVITILIEKGEIQIANKAFFEFFNTFKTLEEFKQHYGCISSLFEEIHDPSYICGPVYKHISWIEKIINNPEKNYKVCIKKDATLHHFAIKIEKVRKKFGNNSFVISLLDITNEITMRENIQTILNSQDNILIIIDEYMHLTYANQKFFTLLNISNIEEFYNKFEFLSDIFLKDRRFFFPQNKQNWIQELLKLQEEQRITSIIDQKDFSQKAFILKPVYLEKTNSYLCSFTEYTKLALETQNLSQKAYTDELTKISNRAKFNEDLHNEIEYFKRYHSPFCLVLFDIDLFKNVNDTYGHDIGDKILQELASLISKHIRVSDIIARWGGEEFVIILNKTSLQEAFSIAENLRKNIEKNNFYHNLRITCSFGISQITRKDTHTTLFKRVDRALYEAKRSGRNCTKIVHI